MEMFGHNAQQHVWRKPKNSISAQTPHTNCQARWWRADDLGLFCSHRTWTSCSHSVHHELLCIPKYSRVKCEAICPTAKAWLKLGHQQDNDPKHSSKSTTECLKKKRIKVLQWSSQSPDLKLIEMLWWDLKRAVHKPFLQTSMTSCNVIKNSGPGFRCGATARWTHNRELLLVGLDKVPPIIINSTETV